MPLTFALGTLNLLGTTHRCGSNPGEEPAGTSGGRCETPSEAHRGSIVTELVADGERQRTSLLVDDGEEWKGGSAWSLCGGGNGGLARSIWALELMGLPSQFWKGRGGGERVLGSGQGQRERFERFVHVGSGVRQQQAPSARGERDRVSGTGGE